MEIKTNGADITRSDKFAGWAIAYTGFSGPMRVGFLGRVAKENDDGSVDLEEAVEFTSILAQTNLGLQRERHGAPIEFTTGIRSLRVRPLALVRLEQLTEEDSKTFDGCMREAKAMRDSLAPGPSLIQPAARMPAPPPRRS